MNRDKRCMYCSGTGFTVDEFNEPIDCPFCDCGRDIISIHVDSDVLVGEVVPITPPPPLPFPTDNIAGYKGVERIPTPSLDVEQLFGMEEDSDWDMHDELMDLHDPHNRP